MFFSIFFLVTNSLTVFVTRINSKMLFIFMWESDDCNLRYVNKIKINY